MSSGPDQPEKLRSSECDMTKNSRRSGHALSGNLLQASISAPVAPSQEVKTCKVVGCDITSESHPNTKFSLHGNCYRCVKRIQRQQLPPAPYHLNCQVEINYGEEWGWCPGVVSSQAPKKIGGVLQWKIDVLAVGSADASQDWSVLAGDADVRPSQAQT